MSDKMIARRLVRLAIGSVLVIGMLNTIVWDANNWGDFPDVDEGGFVITAIFNFVLIFFLWMTSDFRYKTTIAILLTADTLLGTYLWLQGETYDPLMRIVVDFLWLPAIVCLCYEEKFFQYLKDDQEVDTNEQ